MRFEIDKDNAVLIFQTEDGVPSIYQPGDPANEGAPFTSKAAAEKWAKDLIAEIEAAKVAATVVEETPAEEPATTPEA